jgi:outer membrane beta-barrel protein
MYHNRNYWAVCLFSSVIALSATTASAGKENENNRIEIFSPDETGGQAQRASLDSQRFELGVQAGLLSVDDFSTQTSGSVSLSYHFGGRFSLQGSYGRADMGRATFEDVADGNFLSDADRRFEQINLLAGYQVFSGRAYLGSQRRLGSYLYLQAGPNRVSFAGQDNTGITLGLTYKTMISRWLAVNLALRDVIVQRDFLGTEGSTHNLEASLGVSVLY